MNDDDNKFLKNRVIFHEVIPDLTKQKQRVINFIQSLSFNGYILAGNSVSNILEGVKIRGDLDIWVTNKDLYMDAVKEFKDKGAILFEIYPSMIDITIPDLPKINLILSCHENNHSRHSNHRTVLGFDFDYCKCYYDSKSFYATEECMNTIFSKFIRYPKTNPRPSRIKKAVSYGYSFPFWFWMKNWYLKIQPECHLCQLMRSEYCNHVNFKCSKYEASINDLDLNKIDCVESDENLIPTNHTDVLLTLAEFRQYVKNGHLINATILRYRICILNFTEIDLIGEYFKEIIEVNPIDDGDYEEIRYNSLMETLSKEKILSKLQIEDKLENILPTEIITDNSMPRITPVRIIIDDNFERKETERENAVEYLKQFDPLPVMPSIGSITAFKKPADFSEVKLTGDIDENILFKQITLNNECYLTIEYLPENIKQYARDNYEMLFSLHPERRHKIIMYGEEVEVSRWQKSYLQTPECSNEVLNGNRSYMYSGFDTSDNNEDIPSEFQFIYDYISSKDEKYNQVSINWYANDDHIAYHSDCEFGFIENAKICIVNLSPDDNDIKKISFKSNKKISHKTNKKLYNPIDQPINEVDIELKHGMILTMHGKTQRDYKHSVLKSESMASRISLSFRQLQKTSNMSTLRRHLKQRSDLF
jgi:alkylated DNA repair dioxygenase AlkB